jgi:hypothetical protein
MRMTREIDRLWAIEDPAEFTPADIDFIIQYTRQQIAMYDAGEKPSKMVSEDTKAKISDVLAGLTKGKVSAPVAAPKSKMKRRF